MLDISLGEILLILVLTLVVVGPDQVPKVARTIGRVVGGIRRLTDEFRYTMEESIREDDVRRMKEETRKRKEEFEKNRRDAGFDPDAGPDPDVQPYPEAGETNSETEEASGPKHKPEAEPEDA